MIMLSVIMFTIGIFLLIISKLSATGAAIGVYPVNKSIYSNILGGLFVIASIILFTATHNLEDITITSEIKRHSSLKKLTHDAVKDQSVQRELNHLIKELSKGNFEAGLGRPGHIKGTDIDYLRGRNGARLFYHQIGENRYEIVAKSSKGRNEDQVISRIKKLYGD